MSVIISLGKLSKHGQIFTGKVIKRPLYITKTLLNALTLSVLEKITHISFKITD